MKKLFTLLSIALAAQAFAHEGHGVATNSAFHYLSAPHLFVSIGIGLVIVLVVYATVRNRRHRD